MENYLIKINQIIFANNMKYDDSEQLNVVASCEFLKKREEDGKQIIPLSIRFYGIDIEDVDGDTWDNSQATFVIDMLISLETEEIDIDKKEVLNCLRPTINETVAYLCFKLNIPRITFEDEMVTNL